jgi:hypothetical protein
LRGRRNVAPLASVEAHKPNTDVVTTARKKSYVIFVVTWANCIVQLTTLPMISILAEDSSLIFFGFLTVASSRDGAQCAVVGALFFAHAAVCASEGRF